MSKTTQAQIEAAQPRKKIQLASLAAKPKLVSLIVDSDAAFEQFGGDLEFFVKDRYPVHKFMEIMLLAEKAAGNEELQAQVIDKVLPFILDEEGNPIIDGDIELDPVVALEAVHKVVEYLGNLSARNLTGKLPK